MLIKVLGSGCSKCKKLEENVHKAIKESGLDARIEKVTDLQSIMNYGVMSTPALVVDETVVSMGRILSPADILKTIGKR
ncbi:MAG TPA: thioredoxin family protein [Candidatus Cloacimonadota bacterium]|nr:thioredoxin family protein [Candidatus Cloacimonadota bacterium]HPS37970.1 thioredoxin family protein [Candidatus Cloacimonadota bacterium]